MLGWTEILLTTAAVVVVWKWRTFPQIGKQIRLSVGHFREALRGDSKRQVRDVTPKRDKTEEQEN